MTTWRKTIDSSIGSIEEAQYRGFTLRAGSNGEWSIYAGGNVHAVRRGTAETIDAARGAAIAAADDYADGAESGQHADIRKPRRGLADERPAWAGVLNVILKIAAIVGVVLFALAIVGVTAAGLAAAWSAIQHLGGTHFRLAYPVPEVVATATLCTLVASGAYLAYFGPSGRNVARATALLIFIAWIALLVVLAILDMALTAGVLQLATTTGAVSNASQVSNVASAWQIAVPPEVTEVAKVIYAALAPLPVAAGLVLAVVHWSDTGTHDTINHGGAAVGWFMLKLFMATAMFLAEAFFGVYATGNAMLAIFAGLLNAVVFTAVLNAVAAARKEGRPAVVMSVLAFVYAGIMAAIGYEVWLAFGGEKLTYAPKPPLLRTVAEVAFMSSIGLSAFVLVLMRLTTPAGNAPDHAADDTVTIRRPDPLASRIAGGIRGTRAGLGEIADAARGRPALPSGTTATTARDVDALSDDELRALVRGIMAKGAPTEDASTEGDGDPKAAGRREG